jgi:hypothetical protein
VSQPGSKAQSGSTNSCPYTCREACPSAVAYALVRMHGEVAWTGLSVPKTLPPNTTWEYSWMSPAEPVPAQNPDVGARSGRNRTPGRRGLL